MITFQHLLRDGSDSGLKRIGNVSLNSRGFASRASPLAKLAFKQDLIRSANIYVGWFCHHIWLLYKIRRWDLLSLVKSLKKTEFWKDLFKCQGLNIYIICRIHSFELLQPNVQHWCWYKLRGVSRCRMCGTSDCPFALFLSVLQRLGEPK